MDGQAERRGGLLNIISEILRSKKLEPTPDTDIVGKVDPDEAEEEFEDEEFDDDFDDDDFDDDDFEDDDFEDDEEEDDEEEDDEEEDDEVGDPSALDSDSGKKPGRETTLQDWILELRDLRDSHSPSLVRRGNRLRCTFSEVSFDRRGRVSGKCRCPEGIYDLTLDLGFIEDVFDCKCSCAGPENLFACEHSYRFAKYLLAELSDPVSRLRAQLIVELAGGVQTAPAAPTPAAEKTPAPILRFTPPPPVLNVLDRYLREPEPAYEQVASFGEEELPVRLAWRIETHNGLDLVPLKQRGKKRGGGWTKGQRVALRDLRDRGDELVHTLTNERVVDALRLQTGYGYYAQQYLEFEMIEAVSALVGHDAVYVNDDPGEVRRFPFGIRVLDEPQGFQLAVAFPQVPQAPKDEGLFSLWIYSDGIIARPQGQPIIFVCPCSPAQASLAREVLKTPPCPRDSWGALRDRLEKISNTTPVELPESLSGPIVPAETVPVVFLRGNQQGSLECGMRIRDARGRLFLPGEGAWMYLDTDGGKPVQRRRDPEAEMVRARAIERALQLDRARPISDWNWRFLSFEHSLRLLEELETQSKELHFEVAWDPQSVQPVRIMGSVTAKSLRVEVSRKKDWFGINGRCQLGDQEFQLADLLNAVRHEPAPGYLEIKPGQWAKITADLREKLKRLRDAAHQNRKELEISATAAPIVRDLLESQIDIEAPKAWQECLARLDRSQQLNPNPPPTFQGTLRDYQLDGYRWLRRLAEWGVGGCLADDMGLGKTIQALAVLVDRQSAGPALVIAPTSVGFNWVREAQRFAPELKAHLYRETDRGEFLEKVGPGDLVICSYGLSLRDEAKLAAVRWGTLILDEAQFIKNSHTKTSQAIRGFQADWTLALTGTPMENHLGELWSIFRNVSPGLFGSWDNFRDRFAAPIEKNNDDERRLALSRVIRPFVLRRTKSEVLKELPDRTEMNLFVELSDQERRRYDEMRLQALGEIDQIVGMPDTQDHRFRVLAIMTRLRQLACHVGLVDQSWEGNSAKLALLVETLQELKEEGHRALIFSQFTSFLALIRQALNNAGITYQYLDGSTPAKARQERVDAFQAGGSDAFLISLKAGGTGLNLTAADYVIHMDPWWNPAVEDQATDRAHRIGQTRPVMVYRIVARGTIEEQILELHSDKRDLVAGVMEGTQSSARLDTNELISLIRSGMK